MIFKWQILLILAFFSLNGFSDAEKGSKLYSKCISCHGKEGLGKKSQKAPLIAGQYDWYLVSQITAIKNEVRATKNAQKMYPHVKNLSDEDIADLAEYISSLPKKK